MKFYFTFFIVSFVFLSTFSQNINVDTLKVNYIGQKEGLLQLNVIDIEQDDLGYLWVSTQDGLHRFNSNEFKVYLNNPQDSLSIPDDQLRDSYISNDTLFAVGASEGAFGLKLSTNSFFKFFKQKDNNITGYKVLPVNNNVLLFSLSKSFFLFNRTSKKFTEVSLPKTSIENYVNSVAKLNESEFMLATNTSGLLLLNIKKNTLKKVLKVDETSHRVVFKNKNNFIVGTSKGLYLFDESLKHKETVVNNYQINCVYKERKDKLLIGTDKGVLSYDIGTREVRRLVLKDFLNKVYDPLTINVIRGDKKGNIWFGTRGEGLLHFNSFKNKFKTIKLKLPKLKGDNKISSYQFLPLLDSTFLIGSTYGVLKYDCLNKKIKHYKETDDILIYTLKKDFSDNIWAGGYNTGLLKYNKYLDKFEKVVSKKYKITAAEVIEIRAVSKLKLLVATWSAGVYLFDIEKEEFSAFLVGGKQLNRVRVAFIDSKSRIWLGSEEGVYCIDNNGDTINYSTDSEKLKISGNRIFSIKEDSIGNIWLGTNVGLTKIDLKNNKTQLYYKQKGLPNDFIYAVLIDRNNNIWVSTNIGLSVLDTKTGTFTNYTESDGLQNNEFNGKSAFKDEFGNFYFGGIVGVNIFNPEELKHNPFEPEIHIESMELFNSPINRNELFKNFLEFKSDENVLTINYTAINYVNPEKVNYKYFLEGFDKDWRAITKQKSTTYTNLNPGDYIFRIKATNDSGLWSNKEDSIKIRIVPPWYKTLWFKFLFLTMFVVSGIGVYFYKTNKLTKDKLQLELLVDKRTLEITEKNKALEEAYFESEKQKRNINFLMRELKHRVKNNLQIISSLLNIQASNLKDKEAVESLMVAKNRILTISNLENKIDDDNDIVDLKDFTIDVCNSILRILSDEKQLLFEIKYNFTSFKVKDFNTVMYGLVLNELITNTVKYAFDEFSEGNFLEINLHQIKKELLLEIKDNGKGYDQSKLTSKSLGLNLVRDMVSQLKGTIKVDTNAGTNNLIRIPIKEESIC